MTIDGSFVNNFWGSDEDHASSVVFRRLAAGHTTAQDLAAFYRDKALIEHDYAARLHRLAARPLATAESGTTRLAFDTFRREITSIGDSHLREAQQLEAEVLAPLLEFDTKFVAETEDVQRLTTSILKHKKSLLAQIEKHKHAYSSECIKLYSLYSKNTNSSTNSSSGPSIKAHEGNLHRYRVRYENAVREHKLIMDQWVAQWQDAANRLQDLELERINYLKTNLWNVLNLTATTCVKDDKCCENVRVAIEQCDSLNDIKDFVEKFRTGSEIYEAPEFVDYLNGDSDDKDSEKKYTTANFENSFSSMRSSLQFDKASAKSTAIPNGSSIPPTKALDKNPKQVTFTSSTNAGSSYYGDSLNSRLDKLPSDSDFLKQFASLSFKKEPPPVALMPDTDTNFEIKSPFGTIQTASPQKPKKLAPPSSPSRTDYLAALDSSKHNSHDTASSSGSSSGDTHSLARQNTYASSHTSSNFSNSSNKTWSSPTRRKSKLTLHGGLSQQEQEQELISSTLTSNTLANTLANTLTNTLKNLSLAKPTAPGPQDEDSILNTSTMRNFDPAEVGVDDPLRAALEDLKIGGNGDFNALKERHNSVRSSKVAKSRPGRADTNEKLRSSPCGKKAPALNNPMQNRKSVTDILKETNGQSKTLSRQPQEQSQQLQPQPQNIASARPKSMIEIAELNQMKNSAAPGLDPMNSSMHTNANFAASKHPSHPQHPYHHHHPPQPYSLHSGMVVPVAPNGLPLASSDGRPVLRHAKAVYEYRALIPEEVSFKRKDLMVVLAMQDDGWWEVELVNSSTRTGARIFGLAPSNYLVPA